jgi:membrane protein
MGPARKRWLESQRLQASQQQQAGEDRGDPRVEQAVETGVGQEPADRQGRSAEKPTSIPAPGWWSILKRTFKEMSLDGVDLMAAGVAFYIMLAMAPALASAVSIFGLVADPTDVQAHLADLSGVMPGAAGDLVSEQLKDIASEDESSLGIGFAIALLVTLWSATKGTKAIITAINTAYDEEETRGFFRLNAVAMGMTFGLIMFLGLAIGLVAAVPVALDTMGLGTIAETLVNVLRWPLLGAIVLLCLAVLYRYAPCREKAQWRWVTWGSGLATALWLAASAGFSFYVSKWGSYDETYGSLAAVAILLMWLYIGAFVVIFGAELNAEMEHQTAVDTTTGPPKPMGDRGAYVADTLGKAAADQPSARNVRTSHAT